MFTSISRILATGIVVFLGICIVANYAFVGIWQMLLACAGWALAYFGDELAPLVGVTSSPSGSRYVEPVIRCIGWLFLLAAIGLVVVRIPGIW